MKDARSNAQAHSISDNLVQHVDGHSSALRGGHAGCLDVEEEVRWGGRRISSGDAKKQVVPSGPRDSVTMRVRRSRESQLWSKSRTQYADERGGAALCITA